MFQKVTYTHVCALYSHVSQSEQGNRENCLFHNIIEAEVKVTGFLSTPHIPIESLWLRAGFIPMLEFCEVPQYIIKKFITSLSCLDCLSHNVINVHQFKG